MPQIEGTENRLSSGSRPDAARGEAGTELSAAPDYSQLCMVDAKRVLIHVSSLELLELENRPGYSPVQEAAAAVAAERNPLASAEMSFEEFLKKIDPDRIPGLLGSEFSLSGEPEVVSGLMPGLTVAGNAPLQSAGGERSAEVAALAA